MGKNFGQFVVLLSCCGLGFAAAGDGLQMVASSSLAQPPSPTSGATEAASRPAGIDASSVMLPCTPVAAYWTGPPQSEGMPPGPELAVVSTDVRPKDARLYLDDRFVGRTRYLDGRPGYLYLAPGTYHLELRLDGYETLAIDLEAEAGCRFDLKHRLQRVPGMAKETKGDGHGKGKPFNRVFSPTNRVESAVEAASGPDPTLRPDLGSKASSRGTHSPPGAALELRVKPASASIAIDGEFVATAAELDRMEGPLAVTAGGHVIEVTAPRHQGVSRSVELEDGEILELSVDLHPSDGGE